MGRIGIEHEQHCVAGVDQREPPDRLFRDAPVMRTTNGCVAGVRLPNRRRSTGET
jgi:hypothetical protein